MSSNLFFNRNKLCRAKVKVDTAFGAEELAKLLHDLGTSSVDSFSAEIGISCWEMSAKLSNICSELGLGNVVLELRGDEAGSQGAEFALEIALDAIGRQIKVLSG